MFQATRHFFLSVKTSFLEYRNNPKTLMIILNNDYSFPGGSVVNNLPANAGAMRDVGSIPGSERSPEEGNGNPLQSSCLGNPMDREAW